MNRDKFLAICVSTGNYHITLNRIYEVWDDAQEINLYELRDDRNYLTQVYKWRMVLLSELLTEE